METKKEPVSLEELLNRIPKWKRLWWRFRYNTVGRITEAYYKYIRNWNWCVPIPRGFKSRHGYADTPELIEGHVFGLFMRYYEGEYINSRKYSEKDYEDLNGTWKTKELVDKNLAYQKFVEDTAKWITEVWDKQDPNWTIEVDWEFAEETKKRLIGIIKHHDWMWT